VPTVSVLTPSYGYARFLPDAIESVRAQGRADVEHVIVDGASTDGTVELLERERGITWRSEPDEGQSDALNKALSLATGEIVGWLNADEFYLPGAIDLALDAFDSRRADVVFGDAVFVDVEARFVRLLTHHRFSSIVLRKHGKCVSSCSVFIRRSALADDPWDVTAARLMDWDLYLDLERRGATFAYVPRPLGAFRVHDERVTATSMPHDHPERVRIRTRNGLPLEERAIRQSNLLGHGTRIVLKTVGGSYLRERRAQRLRGVDLRWWQRGDHAGQAARLLSRL
jgi:glycosyltransferase involved in cell wall biosynthesis